MPLPTELARHLTEEKIAFVQRSGLRAEVLEPGYVRLRMPGAGNENHIGSMYAGALFTLAEIPGGALFLTSFDSARFYPIVKEMTLRFRRPAKGDIRVEARLDAERIRQLETEAGSAARPNTASNCNSPTSRGGGGGKHRAVPATQPRAALTGRFRRARRRFFCHGSRSVASCGATVEKPA